MTPRRLGESYVLRDGASGQGNDRYSVEGPLNPRFHLPPVIRAAAWWNRRGFWGRGAVVRAIGRIYRGPESFVRTRHGAALSVDYDNLDIYASIHNTGGQWEPHVMATCERLLRPADVFYDIGSNTGLFAIDAAQAIPNLTIYAFEPQPSLAQHVRRSIEINAFARVTCLETMLGAEDGEASLYLTSHSIHASIIPRESRFRTLQRPVRRLDGLVASGECAPPDVVKIDVEGAEVTVFEGARQILTVHTPSVVFEADENMQRIGFKTQDLFDRLLEAAPYKFFAIGDGGELLQAEPPHQLGNFVALSPRHSGRLDA